MHPVERELLGAEVYAEVGYPVAVQSSESRTTVTQ